MCMDAPNPSPQPDSGAPKEINLEDLKPIHSELEVHKPEGNGVKQRISEVHAVAQHDQKLVEQADQLIANVLKMMVEKRASDLHLRAGTPLILRIDGNLIPLEKSLVSPDLAREVLYHMISSRQRKIFEAKSEVDFSFAVHGVGRFRGNAFRQRGSVAIVLRQIPTSIPDFTSLSLPPVMGKFCRLSRGLVLVCGPTGSGKSTTLAAMIQCINEERSDHIVTIEDPIEFLHRDNKSIISQRELGTDTISFSEALKHVLRQDPDVILLGEMRDLETTSTAITAAQTGHLVLSTLHTTDAFQTINRIIDLYPPHQQAQIRLQLADVLKGVICQRLIPHARGTGRVPACEILVVTALVKKAIAENKMADVQEAIRQGQYYGMQTFHQSLLKLYKDGHVKLD
jgi:twitching motility protein PilT